MNFLPSFIYLPSLACIIIIAAVTLINKSTKGALSFGIFSLVTAAWLLPQYIVQATNGNWQALTLVRITTITSLLISYFLVLFILSYIRSSPKTKTAIILLIPFMVLGSFAFSKYGVQQVEASSSGIAIKEMGAIYYITVATDALYLAYGVFRLLKATIRMPKANRTSNYLLLIGFSQAGVIIAIDASAFAGSLLMQLVVPISLSLMVVIVAFAIIKHRLFDIRLIVARSIAYLTSLVVVASIYGFLVFGTADLIFRLRFSIAVQIFISAATAVASLSFANVKRFFDRVTNRLFFRDSYDTQVFFDEFNQTLVATYELNELLKESVKIIEQNIKPVHCQFVINKTANTEGRVMGTANKPALAEDDLKAIKEAISKTQQKLIVADELETKHESLQKRLRAKNIVLAAALSSSSASSSKAEVGYLLLGPKKSGNLYSSQDIKVLEIVANELVIAVQNALRFEEIESFNITLQGKVDEATRKLRRANERLKTLDETKDDFISMASHQLRTPLTSVKGYISMVLEGDAGKISPTQKKLLTQSFFSSQRMVYLIADLLNVSRLRTGKFVIDPTPANLAEVVEQELEQLKETAAVHSLKLTYQKPKHFPELMLDETKTRQVIMNFVDNAIYYTPSGGHIDVRLIENPGTVELRVEDNGIGVPVSEKPHMFTKFYRAGNARKARPDGTGLGLFMAKKVIVAQGGSIIFESQEGKGSTFGFIFSKAKHAVPATSKPKSQTPPAAVKS